MNDGCFREWLESVLPRLKDNAVIVMDNAPYHSEQQDKCPNVNTRKVDIIAWLESKGEVVDRSMVIRELIPIVNRLKPMYNKYVIDEMFNPTELAWSSIKNYVRKNNTTFKLHDVNRLLIESIQRVDSEMWKNCIKYVVDEEDKLWKMDIVVDQLTAEQEPCVLNLAPDDSDSESDLDSDNDNTIFFFQFQFGFGYLFTTNSTVIDTQARVAMDLDALSDFVFDLHIFKKGSILGHFLQTSNGRTVFFANMHFSANARKVDVKSGETEFQQMAGPFQQCPTNHIEQFWMAFGTFKKS
ncbi:hypothetical protein QTP88_011886 [Uroleucon formosanum]